jgi:hypothetical protein
MSGITSAAVALPPWPKSATSLAARSNGGEFQMLKFYFNGSPNPTKVALFLEEAGIAYEPVAVDTRKGDQFKPEYLAINPNAKVPAIDDDGVKVFDSNAILRYSKVHTECLGEKSQRFQFRYVRAVFPSRDGRLWLADSISKLLLSQARVQSGSNQCQLELESGSIGFPKGTKRWASSFSLRDVFAIAHDHRFLSRKSRYRDSAISISRAGVFCLFFVNP